jgi:hypothetical protein
MNGPRCNIPGGLRSILLLALPFPFCLDRLSSAFPSENYKLIYEDGKKADNHIFVLPLGHSMVTLSFPKIYKHKRGKLEQKIDEMSSGQP